MRISLAQSHSACPRGRGWVITHTHQRHPDRLCRHGWQSLCAPSSRLHSRTGRHTSPCRSGGVEVSRWEGCKSNGHRQSCGLVSTHYQPYRAQQWVHFDCESQTESMSSFGTYSVATFSSPGLRAIVSRNGGGRKSSQRAVGYRHRWGKDGATREIKSNSKSCVFA